MTLLWLPGTPWCTPRLSLVLILVQRKRRRVLGQGKEVHERSAATRSPQIGGRTLEA